MRVFHSNHNIVKTPPLAIPEPWYVAGLLNPLRVVKPLPILLPSNFVPKRVANCKGVNPISTEGSFLFRYDFRFIPTIANGIIHRGERFTFARKTHLME